MAPGAAPKNHAVASPILKKISRDFSRFFLTWFEKKRDNFCDI